MTPSLIVLGVVGLIVVVLVMKYNGIIKLRNVRDESFANIDVQLKMRFDLVPNLVNIVKGYAAHEKETLENVTKARTEFLNAGNNIDEKVAADNMLAGALKSIFAVAENYPDLKANTNFMQLQSELSDIENKIAAARRFFNSSTQEYNTYIQLIPNNIIASMFSFKKESMFELTEEAQRENVKVKF